ncbi:plectin isoform X1 [Xenopus laevis]|uniref:Plectin isoform X1 n=1 Tax=Xenopus laevis TaxID=8355 RepID=A0A8J0UQ76_XENLA|nr:plectin isoform X1 [Xenopus laevis]XP_018105793.1 plectin isoform X1 [Xenopus laevis]
MAEVESNNDTGLSSTAAAKETAPVAGVADGTVKTETMESEDEEDVFEVESILDSKIEGGEVLYRVRWKGYDSDGDTWEPEAHLDDCKEVLLGFRKKQAEIQKSVKMEMPTLSPSDLFEADSEGEQSGQKVDSPPEKKKKSREEDEDLALEEAKKRKSKSGKSKEKSKAEAELSDSSSPEIKPKKRLSESKEDLSNKKQKKDDLKESKKTKKEDVKDPKVKGKDELKDKMQKKDKVKECDPPGYARQVSGDLSDSVSGSSAMVIEEKKPKEEQDLKEPEPIQNAPDEMPSELHGMEEEDDDEEEVKVKKKKKKHKRLKTERAEETKLVSDELQVDKKNTQKKQKSLEKLKALSILERLAPVPAPVQKGSRASSEDKGRKSVDSVPEEKEGKKPDTGKEKTRKKQVKKEQKMVKTAKESKNIIDAFTVTPEDRHECTESFRIKEEMPFDYRPVEECKTKELKQVFKERQNTRDESEPWASSEGDQELADPLSQMHDNTEMDTGTAKPRPKQKRRSYEAGFKLKVVSRAEESNNIVASREFCVDEKQVREWRKMKAALEKIPKAKKAQRGSTTSYGTLEIELHKWVMECRQNGHYVTRMGIRLRALQMAKDDKYKAPGIENFAASAGWCSLFMNRFDLCLRRRTTISQKLPQDLDEKVKSFQSFITKQRRIHNYDLVDIGNMDEIPMTFDLPSNRTVASLGDTTFSPRTTGNEKNNFTVVLSCLADGTKLRPFIIFKRKTLPKKVKFPPRITVRAHVKGRMDVHGTKKWLEEIWNGRPGAALINKPSLLVWDMFRAHTSDDVKQLAINSQVTLAVIPGGLTSVLQPLKVSLNKPFKDSVQKMWHEWMSSGQAKRTKAGNLTKPDIELIAKWVRDAWEDIPEDMVQRAFQKCGICNAVDVGEDSALYENDFIDGDYYKLSDDDNGYVDILTPAEIDVLLEHTDDEEEFSFEGF